jgi:hypothetical protein
MILRIYAIFNWNTYIAARSRPLPFPREVIVLDKEVLHFKADKQTHKLFAVSGKTSGIGKQ